MKKAIITTIAIALAVFAHGQKVTLDFTGETFTMKATGKVGFESLYFSRDNDTLGVFNQYGVLHSADTVPAGTYMVQLRPLVAKEACETSLVKGDRVIVRFKKRMIKIKILFLQRPI